MTDEKTDWYTFNGKRIFVELKNGRKYSGIVKRVDTKDLPFGFLTILDKFDKTVIISTPEIIFIEEQPVEDFS